MKLSRVTPCMLLAAGCHAAYVQFIDCSDRSNASTLIPESFHAAVVPGRHAFEWRFDVVVGQLGRNACEIDSADVVPGFAIVDYNHDLEHVSGQVVNRSCRTTDRRGSRAKFTIASTFNRSSLLDTFRTTLELTSQDHTTFSCVKAVLTPTAPKTIRLLSLWLPVTTFILACIAACWPVQQNQSTHFKNTRIARPINLLAYIQFIFFSGSFSLQYPGFFQPLVGLCSWSTLMLPAGVVEATSPYPRAGVRDGIYEHNGTVTGAPGLELLTQMTGSPVKRQSWMNTLVLSLLIFFFLYIAIFIRYRSSNDIKVSGIRFAGLRSQLKNQYWTVMRLFLSCFMLPLSAWATYQFHDGYVFGYQTSIMAMLVLILLLTSFWWSWSQDSDMGSLIVQNPDALDGLRKTPRQYHALVLFSLMVLRGSVIGGLQTYTSVQIGILLGCEVIQLISMVYWVGLPSLVSLAGILSVSRLALFSLNTGFLPGVAEHSVRMLVAYIILCGHLMVLFCIFLLPTTFNLVILVHWTSQASAPGDNKERSSSTRRLFQLFGLSLTQHQKIETSLPLDIESATKCIPSDQLDLKNLLSEMIVKRETSFFSQEKADIASKSLSEFFTDVQGESEEIISKDPAIFSDSSSTLVPTKESSFEIRPATERSLDDLAAHLLATENLAIRNESLDHDLDRPINEYFISSSHNTYLLGRQVATRSKLAGYVATLSQGCRSVEIDCWDGRDGQPIVKHGYSLTKSISFRSVITTIQEHAFVVSDSPLWLSLEVHCSPSQRDIMAGIMVEVFGPSLLTEPLEGCIQALPSPNQLRGKILLKVKFAPTKNVQHINQDLLQSLAVYGAGKRLPRQGEVDIMRNFVYSVSETSFKKHVDSKQPLGLTDTNHMIRVYPDPNRVDSSNFDPLKCWRHGVQMVALNYQTDDSHMSLNQALFHGSSGYVLKAQPEVKHIHLQVDVLLARGIQGLSTVGPVYVEIELLAPDLLSPGVRTAAVPPLEQHTCFDQNLIVSIETKYSNLTFLRWAVKTAPDVLVSSGLAKLDNLKKGYRILPLRNPSRSNIEGGQLLFRI
ncbi:1-phosphatidylinositol-4,5-bisphosphate phosphodiesterase 1 [Fusarium heterosporum]|uniref:Phosphoinositide phospholipase C n=1 Tax=Fusarium heterosporum TaxID=42747 RepID=A0A8H5SWN5_FUSHE|nr:1-phosphatidylinositol-4,5-bisphosphate phosphodiesterase 1 [Fusarium heterosporum]